MSTMVSLENVKCCRSELKVAVFQQIINGNFAAPAIEMKKGRIFQEYELSVNEPLPKFSRNNFIFNFLRFYCFDFSAEKLKKNQSI